MNPFTKAILILRHLGPGWAFFRTRYAIRRRLGGLERRSPVAAWSQVSVSDATGPRFFSKPATVGDGAVAEAEEILRGNFQLFSHATVAVGLTPDWGVNRLGGERMPGGGHWSRAAELAPGDIKGVWELSRFAWAFTLARAFARSRDERFAEAFWRLFEDWLDHNPPNAGPNWGCGQEATFRLMAATFARDGCAAAAATTGPRLKRFQSFVCATGGRIAANLDYALSQSNNHGVSEAIGLLSAGILLPGATESGRWRAIGLAALRSQLEQLVYPDGAFSQHSANYHRVLLHDLSWSVVALRAAQEPPPAWLLDAGRRALALLDAAIDPGTGRVPLYGANDGANVLPLSDCGYLDFRPVVQASHAVFHGAMRLPSGKWDEAAGWLAPEIGLKQSADGGRRLAVDGRQAALRGKSPDDKGPVTSDERRHFPDGGILLWRNEDTRLFFRCPTRFRHRPSQADLLHVGVEWRGLPIAIDAGTYSYHTRGPFAGGLKEAAVHSTVTLDDGEPMEKAGRFLYLPWPAGEAGWTAEGDAFEATHDGWKKRGVRHRRRVRAIPGGFAIEDGLDATRRTRARLHWLLADQAHELDAGGSTLRLATAQGAFALEWETPADTRVTLVRADPGTSRGWWSPHYHQALPALSLALEFDFIGETKVVTTFAPAS